MRLGKATIIRADARRLPLSDNSVDLVVTSPPYLNLRAYQDNGQTYDGQIGSESDQAAFLDALLEVTAECARVIKSTGSIFVNLGDSYRDKGLQFTPERYRIRCVDELGLIARAVIVWSKPNGLPESVTDRVRRSHEDWVHFTLSPRYFSAVDEIREPVESRGLTYEQRKAHGVFVGNPAATGARNSDVVGIDNAKAAHPLGKLPGSVWTVPTEPLRVPDHLGIDHFAAFPTEWPKRIIQGWSPAGVCVECGEGRRPVTERDSEARRPSGAQYIGKRTRIERNIVGANRAADVTTTHAITGYACDCPQSTAPTTPAVILDPFGGTGTTAMVAKALGRHGISVDMSADYCRLAEWRTNDRDQLAKVLGIEKAEQQPEDQMDLLTMLDGGAA